MNIFSGKHFVMLFTVYLSYYICWVVLLKLCKLLWAANTSLEGCMLTSPALSGHIQDQIL